MKKVITIFLLIFAVLVGILGVAIFVPNIDKSKQKRMINKPSMTKQEMAIERQKLIDVFIDQNPDAKEEDIQISFDKKGVPHIIFKP